MDLFFEFSEKPVRTYTDKDGVWGLQEDKFVSVLDVISAITEVANIRNVLAGVRNAHPEVAEKIKSILLPGTRSATAMATVDTVIEVIMLLPGKRAAEYRAVAATTLRQFLNPTDAVIDELQLRKEMIAAKPLRNNLLSITNEKTVSLPSRAIPTSQIYVRVRYPEQYVQPDTGKSRFIMMTDKIIKFGITHDMNDRNNAYNRFGLDNGFMAYSFETSLRHEAQAIETILKGDYKLITIGTSFEYVDAQQLAGLLNVPYQEGDYNSYMKVAECLFRRIVKLARQIWPEKYSTADGVAYSIVESIIPDNPGNSQVMFVQNKYALSPEDLGTSVAHVETLLNEEKKAHDLTQQKLIRVEIENRQLKKFLPKSNIKPIVLNKRSKGAIIARDIVTGREVMYASVEGAARQFNYTPASIRRSFLGHARQLRGFHFRTQGQQFWMPPEGFEFDPNNVAGAACVPVAASYKGINRIRCFESISSAAKILKVDRRTLNEVVDKDIEFAGCVWKSVPSRNWGTWHDAPTVGTDLQNEAQQDTVAPSSILLQSKPKGQKKNVSGQDGRCNGKIIARNIKTGHEIIYDSLTKAASALDCSAHALAESFLDKPRQAKGFTLRAILSSKYWQPPTYFKYEEDSIEHGRKGYLIRQCMKTNEITLYESFGAASRIEGISKWGIASNFDSGNVYKDFIWRSARPEEYETFVDLPSTSNST